MRYNIPPLPFGYYLGQVIRTYQTTDQNGNERCNIDVDIVFGGWHDYYAMYTEYRELSFSAGVYSIRIDKVNENDIRIKDYILQHKGDRILVAIEVGEERYGKENKYRGITNLYDWRECEKLPADVKEWAEAHENNDVCDNTPSSYTMLPYALRYAGLGYKVFPLQPQEKKPLQGSKGCKEATTDFEQIRKWWSQNTMYNIGLATGNGYVVIDVDVGEGKTGDKALAEWEANNGKMPPTLSATTGKGGKHMIYRAEKEYKNKAGVISNVDVRGEGGYIVAPPSVHPNGNRYMWDNGFNVDRIAIADDVVDRLINAGGKVAADKTTAKITNNNTIPEGKRNDTIYRIGCGMQARGVVDEKIYEELVKTNKERCNPPLDNNEIEKIYNSVIQLPKGTAKTHSNSGLPQYEDEIEDCSVEDYIARIQAEYPYVDVIYAKGKDGEQGSFRYNFSAPRLAEYIRDNEHYFFLDSAGDKPIAYWYENGVYKQCNDRTFCGHIKGYIAVVDGEKVDPALINKVYKLILTDLDNTISADSLNADSNIINFANGILCLDTMELKPHSPNIISTVQLPCSWNPTALSSPVFNNFLDTLVDGDDDIIQLLWEYAGYCFSNVPGYLCKQALFLYGKGNTGKSQYLALIQRILGSDNCCNITLQRLEERFGTSAIFGKRLAGAAEMSTSKISELEMFKSLTGGDMVDFEYKGKDHFSARYNGLLMFCANELPQIEGDRGNHVYERMILVKCNNVIPEEKRDRFLIEKIYAEREAIVFHAVIALKKLIDRGTYFRTPDICRKNREKYAIYNDNVRQFLIECTDQSTTMKGIGTIIKTSEMYENYCNWCTNTNYITVNRKEFRKSISNHFGKPIGDLEKISQGTYYYTFGYIRRD